MPTRHESTEPGRSACSRCPVRECPAEDDRAVASLAGWRLGLISVGLFVGPIVLAVVGAIVVGGSAGTQLLGALAGLGLGMAGSVIAARRLRHRSESASLQ